MGDLRSSLSNLRSSADNFSGNHCYYRNQHFKTTQPCAKPSESSKQPMSLNHFNYTFTLCTCTGGFQPKYCMHFLINSFWDSNLHSFWSTTCFIKFSSLSLQSVEFVISSPPSSVNILSYDSVSSDSIILWSSLLVVSCHSLNFGSSWRFFRMLENRISVGVYNFKISNKCTKIHNKINESYVLVHCAIGWQYFPHLLYCCFIRSVETQITLGFIPL